MEVVRLNHNLFNKLRGKEISSNKNGSRPYYYSFKRNNNRVCTPFRTNAQKVPNKYKVNLGGEQLDKPNSAIDLTKSIVILVMMNILITGQKSKYHKMLIIF